MSENEAPGLLVLPEVKPRVETGPVQFGGDWPGLFVRGDGCIELKECLEAAIDQRAMPDRLGDLKCQEWIELIDRVIVNGSKEPEGR